MWTMDTRAAEVAKAHNALVRRVNPKMYARGCPGMAWVDTQLQATPSMTIADMLDRAEAATASGDLTSRSTLDLIAAQGRHFAPDIVARVLKLLTPKDLLTAQHHLSKRP
jgi:hypothetical protein